MANDENKTVDTEESAIQASPEKAADKALDKKSAKTPVKKATKKDKKSILARIGAWFRSLKAELGKIVWASWKTVRTNTTTVLVSVIVLSALIGVVDYFFSKTIVILSILIG